jgi:hypothetical protein
MMYHQTKEIEMKKVLSFASLLILLSVGSVVYVIIRDYPALTVRKSADVSVSQTIIDHKLPKLHTSYKHSGKPELVVTKVWTDESTNLFSQVYWCKVIDKKQEQEKALWRKITDKLIAMLRFMSFDERGAFLLTERSYVEDNEVLPGDYIYLGSLRLTVHVEGQGTGVWEFPGYVDQSMPFEKLNSILRLKEKEMIEIVRQMMYSTTTPEESYKVKQVERGAMRRETMQPWINISCDITLEYLGDGINAR